MATFTSAQLLAEIQTDPTTLGYAALVTAGNDSGVADLLNLARAGIQVRRTDIGAAELLDAIDVRDLGATLTPAHSWFESVTQTPKIRLANADGTASLTRQNLNQLLANTNGSQARLAAIAKRAGSRAEQLWGTDTVVATDDVSHALRPNG